MKFYLKKTWKWDWDLWLLKIFSRKPGGGDGQQSGVPEVLQSDTESGKEGDIEEDDIHDM